MEKEELKKELERLKNMKGECRGVGIKSNIDFIKQREGEEAVKKVEDKMAEIGYPVVFKEIKAMDFYPLAAEGLLLLVIKEVFDYSEMDFQEMGRSGAKSSLIIRFFTKYFVSEEKFISKPPEMWKKYFTAGNLNIEEFNPDEKRAVVRLRNFFLNKSHCQLLIGFISALVEMVMKVKARGREIKCMADGGEYNEFLIEWE